MYNTKIYLNRYSPTFAVKLYQTENIDVSNIIFIIQYNYYYNTKNVPKA